MFYDRRNNVFRAYPLIADVDGDGELEVITADWSKIYAIDRRGRIEWTLPFGTIQPDWSLRTLDGDHYDYPHTSKRFIFADIDGDGFGEIVGSHLNSTAHPFKTHVVFAIGDTSEARTPSLPGLITQARSPERSLEYTFGATVAISGNTAVVGDTYTGGRSGALFVYERGGAAAESWTLVKKIVPSDAVANSFLGGAISIDGDLITANSSSGVYVFRRDEGGQNYWGQVKKIAAPADLTQPPFGSPLAVNGETLVAGAPGDNHAGTASGSVYVFSRNQGGPNQWGFVKKLVASDAVALGPITKFGQTLAVSGDTIAVGASLKNSVYLFERNRGGLNEWGEALKLPFSPTDPSEDYFGRQLDLDGDSLVVGAIGSDGEFDLPRIRVFERNQGGADNWGIAQLLPLDDILVEGETSLAISGDHILVGIPFNIPGTADAFAGTVRLFTRRQCGAADWVQSKKVDSRKDLFHELFGQQVDISGGNFIVGARSRGNLLTQSGSAYLFEIGAESNRAPSIALSIPATIEAIGPEGSPVILKAQLSDPDGDTLLITWRVNDVIVKAGNIPASGSATPVQDEVSCTLGLGLHQITLTVQDSACHTVTGATTITVRDTKAPMVFCPTDITIPFRPETVVPVNFSAPSIDICDPAPVINYSHAPGSGFPSGTTVVRVTARDASGNQSECSFMITRQPLLAGSFVALGQLGVLLKQGITVASGNVGANQSGDGPFLANGSEVTIGQSVTFQSAASRVFGNTVKIKQLATVFDVHFNQLDADGQILGQQFTPISLPVVPAFPTLPSFTPGTQNIQVPHHGTLLLAPDRYRELVAREHSLVELSGGIYDFTEFDIHEHSQVRCLAPTEIRISGRLNTDGHSFFGPAPSANGLNATAVRIFVQGSNGNNGNLAGSPKAAKFGEQSTIIANIYAPNGTVWVREGSSATGAFLGKWVLIGENVTLRRESGF